MRNFTIYNCFAYIEKVDSPKDIKQGDLVKLSGQIRNLVHINIRILSSKLLKVKEHMKVRYENKESVRVTTKKYKAEDKEKLKEKKEVSK